MKAQGNVTFILHESNRAILLQNMGPVWDPDTPIPRSPEKKIRIILLPDAQNTPRWRIFKKIIFIFLMIVHCLGGINLDLTLAVNESMYAHRSYICVLVCDNIDLNLFLV